MTLSEQVRWRRRVEDGAAIVVLGGLAALPDPSLWTRLLLATVALVVGLSRAGGRRGAGALMLCALLVTVATVVGEGGWREASRQLVVSVAAAGVPWLVGSAWRLRTQVRRQAAQRVAEDRRQRSLLQQQQRDAERLALAQTLHDELGHALSLVALNLGRLELDPRLDPSTRQSVATARGQLSQATGRLGSSVAALRHGAPQGLPPHDDVRELIEQARQAGADLHLADWPPPERLKDVDQPTLTRVLREALTNASKHAAHRPITIHLSDRDDLWRLSVHNPTGRQATQIETTPPGPGTGLAALGRHLDALGGRLDIVNDAEGFTLQADIPLRHAAGADSPPEGTMDERRGDTDESEEEALLAGARRRGRLILVGAALLIVTGLGVVELLRVAETRATILSADHFAQIDVGDARGEVESLLPDHELSPQPAGEPGADCHDYAITADPLDDASGDVYRICFAEGVVASARLITGDDR